MKLFDEIPYIDGKQTILHRLSENDAPAIDDLRNNAKVKRYLPTYLAELEYNDIHELLNVLYTTLFDNKENLFLGAYLKETGECMGIAEFYDYKTDSHEVSIGIRLREAFWGKGFASDILHIMLEYLFENTDIETVTTCNFVENRASSHLVENNGFTLICPSVSQDWGYDEPVIAEKWIMHKSDFNR